MSESLSSISVHSSKSNLDYFDENIWKEWKQLPDNIIDNKIYKQYLLFLQNIFKIDENIYYEILCNIIFNISISQYILFEKKLKIIDYIENKNSKLVFSSTFVIGYIQIIDIYIISEFIKKSEIKIKDFIECTSKIIELYEKGKNNKDNVWYKECLKRMNEEELNKNIIKIKEKILELNEELIKEELSSDDDEPPTKNKKQKMEKK